MTHSIDDDWQNREYSDPLSDPKKVEAVTHGNFWDDPEDYLEIDEDDWDDEVDYILGEGK